MEMVRGNTQEWIKIIRQQYIAEIRWQQKQALGLFSAAARRFGRVMLEWKCKSVEDIPYYKVPITLFNSSPPPYSVGTLFTISSAIITRSITSLTIDPQSYNDKSDRKSVV